MFPMQPWKILQSGGHCLPVHAHKLPNRDVRLVPCRLPALCCWAMGVFFWVYLLHTVYPVRGRQLQSHAWLLHPYLLPGLPVWEVEWGHWECHTGELPALLSRVIWDHFGGHLSPSVHPV